MNSIRAFLVAVNVAVIMLFIFVAALKGFQSSMLEAERLLDKQLLDTARLLASLHASQGSGHFEHDSSIAFQVWREGRLVAASANTPQQAFAPVEPGFGHSNFAGYRWRTATYREPRGSDLVMVADRTDLRYALAENVILESLFPALAGVPLLGLLIWLLISQGLRPLRKLAEELASKRADDLGPLSIQRPKQELQQIVASCNGLLHRLEAALLREREFASDAAHELRTPISALKLQVHNLSLDWPGDADELAALEATVLQLQHIVEQVLDLYRASPERFNASFQPVDLCSLAQDVLAERCAEFEARGQSIELDAEPCTVMGDRFALVTLLGNLLSNANRYTPAGGQVHVTVHHHQGQAQMVVEDSGPGIPDEQREAVFHRFHRLGGDRHASGVSGCGLGLAIVRRLAELHGATVSVRRSRFPSGAAFVLRFPAELPAPSAITAAAAQVPGPSRLHSWSLALAWMALGICVIADAAPPVFEIEIREHLFYPAELVIPADTKVKLLVKNMDVTPEEFESYELNREKVINGNSQAVIFVGPLPPGSFPFFGEFNPKTAQGRIIVE